MPVKSLRIRARSALQRAAGMFLLVFAIALPGPAPFAASSDEPVATKPSGTGLPVPRFVSLKAGRVNVRIGPG